MNYEHLIYEKSDYIARVTLNRPKTLNAMCPPLNNEISRAIAEANEDDDVKVIIFKGAGRSLCAGADLNEVGFVYGWQAPKSGEKATKPSQRVRVHFDRKTFWEQCQELLLCHKLTVVQAHGHLLGAGLNFFLNADLLIASEDCKLGHVEERLGLAGLTMEPMMVHRCGLTKALELCITGKMISGIEAVEAGMINRAVPADKLEQEVEELAAGLARYPRDLDRDVALLEDAGADIIFAPEASDVYPRGFATVVHVQRLGER
ncbi:MAG: pantoate--beta-alanine ligase, partial [Dehalococcoidales bacterium]|nr:pantoate--beta-alanine ligase [Dehalococcoidales bacterium]